MASTPDDVLWSPTPSVVSHANITRFCSWLSDERHLSFDNYADLWAWSVTDLGGFWTAVAGFYAVRFDHQPSSVLGHGAMPGAEWFPGATLNYADHALARRGPDPALFVANEDPTADRTISWDELGGMVGSWATALRQMGVTAGDRVVGVLPNIPEAVVALLGAASIGAVWACCGPDLGLGSIVDRLGQLHPTVLVASAGCCYGGQVRPGPDLDELRRAMPSLRHVVVVDYPEPAAPVPGTRSWSSLVSAGPGPEPEFEPVAFDHPLWVLFTSGTTGLPKGIVHGHGGIVVEHLKLLGLHADVHASDRVSWYTSTTWMMWNYVMGALLHGATAVLYDGSPAWPSPDAWWDVSTRAGVTLLGTSPGYLLSCRKNDAGPAGRLGALRSLGVTGSPLPAPLAQWTSEQFGGHIPVQSVSGGTDVCSAFLAALPTLPVVAGETQCKALGAAVEAWDPDGRPVVGTMGELVITRPMPSMPIRLWDDQGYTRYRQTYFEPYGDVWRHGDWITLMPDGGAVVHGRSDSTLNRNGVRAGTSELYQAVEALDQVEEALAIGLDHDDGTSEIVLFVALRAPAVMDDSLEAAIRLAIRQRVSPRHVPDHIVPVPGIPHTLTGKKLEVPVKRVLSGVPREQAFAQGAVDRPELLDHLLSWRAPTA